MERISIKKLKVKNLELLWLPSQSLDNEPGVELAQGRWHNVG